MKRSSGILLPIFSLPSEYGIGTFGKEAYKFVDYLVECNVEHWQILPLNPTSYGDSPYQSFSAYAINSYFIDLDILKEEKLLTAADLRKVKVDYSEYIEYGDIYNTRFDVLRKAYANFLKDEINKTALEKFEKKHKAWIKDYAIFMVLKYVNGGNSYQDWSFDKLIDSPLANQLKTFYNKYGESLRLHDKKSVDKIKKDYQDDYYFWIFLQLKALEQYIKLKKYANSKGIKIVGDIPIYVALDSADTWANPEQFLLDNDNRPTLVAGVPPDYFSADGQLWGNPLYNYKKMEEDNFTWWKDRINHCKDLYDVLRIDHFRGMASYYTIPFGNTTAREGEWLEGPRMKLVNAIKEAAGEMEIIAEDLGLLTPDVTELKNNSGWPGLKIVEFGFDGANPNNPDLPKFYTENDVAYIGTHDNDTLLGYLDSHRDIQNFIFNEMGVSNENDLSFATIGNLFRSNAKIVIVTMQDLLKQNTYHRINTPGTLGNNWKIRLPQNYQEHKEVISLLKALVKENNRA